MSDFTWDPNTYLDVMAEEIPDYRRLQSELAAAVAEADPRRPSTSGWAAG